MAIASAGAIGAFFQVLMIDLALAGDNAVAVGMAASGLPAAQRRKAILFGLAGAVVMLITFSLVAVQLLKVIGLLFAGGVLLLWVSWKMWRDLRDQGHVQEARGELALEDATGVSVTDGDSEGAAALPRKAKTLFQALLQIIVADISMSLDNVLAVAGAAREHPQVLVAGLLISITLMGVAASWIAKLLHRWRWLGYVGLAIVFWVSVHMIWEGHRQAVIDLGGLERYNALAPAFLDITAEEVRVHHR